MRAHNWAGEDTTQESSADSCDDNTLACPFVLVPDRVTDEGIRSLSLSGLCSLSYGYTSMPEADDMAAAIAQQFTALTGALSGGRLLCTGCLHCAQQQHQCVPHPHGCIKQAAYRQHSSAKPAGHSLPNLLSSQCSGQHACVCSSLRLNISPVAGLQTSRDALSATCLAVNSPCALGCAACAALDLLASELTDSGLLALSRLPQLQLLKLYQAGVTASGLEQLAEQPAGKGLTGLVLYGTGALAQLSCLGEGVRHAFRGSWRCARLMLRAVPAHDGGVHVCHAPGLLESLSHVS
jgi:hypothetical protein